MSYRLKITLPDPVMGQLEALAASVGEPASRLAAEMVRERMADPKLAGQIHRPRAVLTPTRHGRLEQRPQWLEPYGGDRQWRALMWGGIVALHGRYPQALARLKIGWWENQAHVEMLCALVAWRDWIDDAGSDPREELAFHAQLADYGHMLRQEGGGVTKTWTPGAPPDEWCS